MKIIHIIAFMSLINIAFGQDVTIYDCKGCGTFLGEVDKVAGDNTNHIIVKLNLIKDSTFYFEIAGVFSWCTSKVFSGQGKWFIENQWLYLKLDENNANSFVIGNQHGYKETDKEVSDKEYIANRLKYLDKGFGGLPIILDKTNTETIYFGIAYDCFENSWSNNPVRRIDPKKH